jgi:UDP-glucose 4-epimerase
MKTNKNILVTGGLGYIGAHVVKSLISSGFKVTLLDNIWHNRPNHVVGANIVHGDLNDNSLLETLFDQEKFTAVVHMAAFIQVGESSQEPEKYFQNNVINSANLLSIMRKYDCNTLVFSSTAAIFGNPQYTPIDELHPRNPLNPYGRYKLIVEELLQDFHNSYGLNFGVLRYFNAAGCDPDGSIGELHEPETHLIPLILQVASGRKKSIAIYGDDYPTIDGTCIRDYIHVNDLSEAHGLLLKYLWAGGTERYFNLGVNKGYSVKEVIAICEKVTGVKINVEIQPRRVGDSPVLLADGNKARTILAWEPQYSDLETIIKHAWAWELRGLKNVSF